MKKDFENSILESGALMRAGYRFIGEHTGKLIAALTALLAVLLTFTDIGFLGFGQKELTSSLIVLLISSYVIYFSMADAGERLGRESDEYKARAAEYESLRSRVRLSSLEDFRHFCLEYQRAELEFRREQLLFSAALSKEDLALYNSGKSYPRAAVKAFRRAERLKPLKLTPESLLFSRAKNECGSQKAIERGRFLPLFLKLLPTTICTLFTASIVISTKSSLDAAGIIEGIIKLGTLPIVAMRGYIEGYTHSREALTSMLEARCDILSAFLKE